MATNDKPAFGPLLTEADAIAEALAMRDFSIELGEPSPFEVVKLAKPHKDGSRYNVQPFGIHVLFQSHKLVFVAEIEK